MSVIPYDVDYATLNRLRKYENWFFLLSMIFSFFYALQMEFNILVKNEINDLTTLIGLLLFSGFVILKIYNDYFLFPSCENKRRLFFIDNSFQSKMAIQVVPDDFFNKELSPGLYKLAVNGFENCFFTYHIVNKMVAKYLIKNGVLAIAFFVFAYIGFKNMVFVVNLILQLVISSFFVDGLIKYFIYKKRVEYVFNQFCNFFSDPIKKFDNDKIAKIIRMILEYETLLSWSTISIDSKIYNKSKDQLNKEWEELKKRYQILQLQSK
ncbi:MAG TPA: hypothetical protein PKW76_10220 [bacterium]|nr:hypothetical protein [bacterium]HPG46047.1 hypothetical protein [bacterium]HPM97869.1 hypothetical protein [bacterium]